jgi:cell pole-organizing protein PopZ
MGMEQSGEPSVEEILESIKKVIARENGAGFGSAALGRRRSLTEPVEPAAADEAEEVLELDEDAMVALAAEQDAFEAEEERAAYGPAIPDPDAPLTGEATSTAMRDNFAALAMLAQPSRPPQIVRSGETSVEELTRELLRPMLAKWLDENLPGMVEELVKAEIARIAGKKS